MWVHCLQKDWEVLHRSATTAQQPPTHPHNTVEALYDDAPEMFRTRANALVDAATVQDDKDRMHSHSTLQHLPNIRLRKANIQPYLLVHHDKGLGTLLKMRCRTGTLQVNALLARRRIQADSGCPLCGEQETIPHFFLHCPAYLELRTYMLQQLSSVFPTDQAFQRFRAASDEQITCNLLSDMFWSELGQLELANGAVCGYLQEAWDVRQRYITDLAMM